MIFIPPCWDFCSYEKYICISFSKYFIWKFLTLTEWILNISTHRDPHAVLPTLWPLLFTVITNPLNSVRVAHMWYKAVWPSLGQGHQTSDHKPKGEWLAFYCVGLMHNPSYSVLMMHASFHSPYILLLPLPGGSLSWVMRRWYRWSTHSCLLRVILHVTQFPSLHFTCCVFLQSHERAIFSFSKELHDVLFSSINSLMFPCHVPFSWMSRWCVGFCKHKRLYNTKAGLRIHLCPHVTLSWGKNRASVESSGVFSLSESLLWILHKPLLLFKLLLSECRGHLFRIACLYSLTAGPLLRKLTSVTSYWSPWAHFRLSYSAPVSISWGCHSCPQFLC